MKHILSAAVVPALALSICLLGGCSSIDIDSEWDRSVDFDAYRTYAWIPQDTGLPASQQLPKHLDIRLRRVVDDIMNDEKGFVIVPVLPEADLLFAYYVDTQKNLKVDYTVYGSYYGGYGYGAWSGYRGAGYAGYGGGGAVSKVREYTSGTIVVDIVDRRTKTLVWTGIVAGDAKYENPSGDRVQKVMEEVLKQFPPEKE